MSTPARPAKDELLQQFELLKDAYVKLLNDKDVLLHWGKPQLEALYATRIGRWQIERLQLQLRIKALKRKTEMVLSALNRNLPVDVNEIELQVAIELAAAEATIMEQAAQLEQAKDLLGNLDTPQRSAELRTLYRQMAKQLHPDVNPDLTEAQRQVWQLVKDAYASGDLDKLKALQLVYEKELQSAGSAANALGEDELGLRIATLKEGIRVLDEQIAAIRAAFPFTMEEQIKDDAWVAEETTRIKEELTALQQYEKELETAYQQLTSTL